MPHPKGLLKQSGDVHLPDVESDLAVEEGHTGLESLAQERTRAGRVAARKAGLVTDPDLGSASRLARVTRGEPIPPGTEPLAGFQPAPRRRTRRMPLAALAFAVAAGALVYRMASR